MKDKTLIIVFSSLLTVLVACTPAETSPDSPAPGLEPSPAPAETDIPPSPSSVPAEPTNSPMPSFTATPTRLAVEIVPETPAKPMPTLEDLPMPPGATAVLPTDPASLELIDRAKTDLAQRTGIAKDEIILIEFRYVTWPDASMGCPEPGMGYADVLVDGYLITLRAGTSLFYYYGASAGGGPSLCQGTGAKIIVLPPFRSSDK